MSKAATAEAEAALAAEAVWHEGQWVKLQKWIDTSAHGKVEGPRAGSAPRR